MKAEGQAVNAGVRAVLSCVGGVGGRKGVVFATGSVVAWARSRRMWWHTPFIGASGGLLNSILNSIRSLSCRPLF